MDQLTRTFEKAAEEVGAAVEVTPDIRLIAYDIPKDAPVVTHFKEACEKLGLAGTLTETFGGSDNNNFVLHGIQGIVLILQHLFAVVIYPVLDGQNQSLLSLGVTLPASGDQAGYIRLFHSPLHRLSL